VARLMKCHQNLDGNSEEANQLRTGHFDFEGLVELTLLLFVD